MKSTNNELMLWVMIALIFSSFIDAIIKYYELTSPLGIWMEQSMYFLFGASIVWFIGTIFYSLKERTILNVTITIVAFIAVIISPFILTYFWIIQ